MKILVTGGAGFIGSWIVDLLIEEGYQVIVVDNLSLGRKANINSLATFYEVDILNKELDEIIAQELPEIIIHQAALVYIQQSLKDPLADGMVNAMGTLNILNSATRHKVKKIIYASTCAVYGEPQEEVIKEEHPLQPLSFYGVSKLMGEMYIRLFAEIFNLDYTILRYANVYGPRQEAFGEGGVIPIFMEQMGKGQTPTIFGDGNQTRDFIYVTDVARANLLAIYKGSRQVLNIGTGKGTTINHLYSQIAEIMKFGEIAQYSFYRPGDAKHVCLDPSKAKAQLLWEPKFSLNVGLKEAVKFYYN